MLVWQHEIIKITSPCKTQQKKPSHETKVGLWY